MNQIIVRILITFIAIYKRVLSPLLPPLCRYMPTCADYSREALSKHGLIQGLGLAIKRISKCRPLGSQGYDPVP